MPQTEYAIQLEHVTKTFGPVIANHDVTMNIRRGEILSLLGENGSGKTTLMNMIAGIYYPDGGQIIVNGQPADIRSPRDALALGICMIHQHFKLVDVFTAVENIALSMDKGEKFDLRRVRDKARAICEKYQFALDLDQKVYEMSVSQKQTLEIVKVLFRGADILILDEPTAVLTPQETEKLFAVIRNMKADGKAVVIITHKLHEVLSVSDRVAILRKGEYVGTVETAAATEASLTEMMVGQKVELNINRTTPQDPTRRLAISHLSVRSPEGTNVLDDVSLTPSRRSLGMMQSSMISSQVEEPRMPILSSGLPTLKPGSVRSTMNAEISFCLRPRLSVTKPVTAMIMKTSA